MNKRGRSLLLGAGLVAGLLLTDSGALAEKSTTSTDSKYEKVTKLLEFEKSDAEATAGWLAINDDVMGGRSAGGVTLGDGVLLFSGKLSLANNGGFSSIRTEGTAFDLSMFDGLVLRVRGDGRPYQLRFSTNARFRGSRVAYRGDFETVEGEWMEIRVPFAKLTPTFRGQDLEGPPFEAAEVGSIGFLIADKKPGKFQLEVQWLGGYTGE